MCHIKVDGQIVGGIGVSGGHNSQDMEVAKAGLTVIPQPVEARA